MSKRSSTHSPTNNPTPHPSSAPLADRMRPVELADLIGHEKVVGEGTMLRRLIESQTLTSLILWGPPGVGKTTLAEIIARTSGAVFEHISAVMSGKEEVRAVVARAEERLSERGEKTILFVDEIHRWSKAQQDALLPYVEKGLITLIGATTENPSFEIIGALLSRCRVVVLSGLSEEAIERVLERALNDKEKGFGTLPITCDKSVLTFLAEQAGGDARTALNALDIAVKSLAHETQIVVTVEVLKEALQRTHLVFDKRGEEFYNLISALHKSMRGSDANASLYWLARMLEGGADPLYVARRVLRFASEDIGMANSEALVQANAAYDACHKIGFPECSVHLAQAVVYCAKSAKSNLLYRAYGAAAEDARATSHLGVPLHLRNAPTKLMKDLEYGKNYKYNPDFAGAVQQEYLPTELQGKKYIATSEKK
jgi:putative ATPase